MNVGFRRSAIAVHPEIMKQRAFFIKKILTKMVFRGDLLLNALGYSDLFFEQAKSCFLRP